jgi:hypothetical protein
MESGVATEWSYVPLGSSTPKMLKLINLKVEHLHETKGLAVKLEHLR